MVSAFGFIMVVIAVLMWASASIGYKKALGADGVSIRNPITSMFVRIFCIFLFMIPFGLLLGDLPSLFSMQENVGLYWTYAFLSGVFGVGAEFCYFNALRRLDSSRVYPLINTQTLFTFPFSYFIFGESITALLAVAAVMMIFGVLFIGGAKDDADLGMNLLDDEKKKKNYIYGILGGIGTGFFFALGFITLALQNQIYNGIVEANTTRTLFYTLLMTVIMIVSPKNRPKYKTDEDREMMRAYLMTGLFGIISFGIGDSLYQIGVQLNGTAISIIIASSAPILNQVFSIAFLKEKFRWKFMIGVVLIIFGNILAII